MKFTNALNSILGHKSKVKILRYLLNTKLELTGRELSRAVGMHHRTCHSALQELASFGIVDMRQAGRAIVYKINDNNLIVQQALRPIFNLERDLLPQTIKILLKNIRVRIISGIVFGSIASSLERATSDVDVLFLVSSKKEQQKLMDDIEKREYNFILQYGNRLSPLVLTLNEFYKRLKQRDKLIQDIIQKGKSVYGKTIQEVLIQCRQKQ